jgi:hypothetical protein
MDYHRDILVIFMNNAFVTIIARFLLLIVDIVRCCFLSTFYFKLQATMEYFATYARGSSYKRYAQQLIEQCTRLWHDGRQLCESISLTRNPCKNEVSQ